MIIGLNGCFPTNRYPQEYIDFIKENFPDKIIYKLPDESFNTFIVMDSLSVSYVRCTYNKDSSKFFMYEAITLGNLNLIQTK